MMYAYREEMEENFKVERASKALHADSERDLSKIIIG